MMKLIYTIVFATSLISFSACNDSATANAEQQADQATNTENTNATADNNAGLPQLPPIPMETLKYLHDNCDYIDYIFYNEDFSLNQAEPAAIQAMVRGVSPQSPTLNGGCQPMGRVFWQVDGQNAAEADFYLAQGCVYYIFMKDNKPTYANLMTEAGAQFYINILSSVRQGQAQQQ